MNPLVIAMLLTLAANQTTVSVAPPFDIATITQRFDSIVNDFGFDVAVARWQEANHLSDAEVVQYMIWMRDARVRESRCSTLRDCWTIRQAQ